MCKPLEAFYSQYCIFNRALSSLSKELYFHFCNLALKNQPSEKKLAIIITIYHLVPRSTFITEVAKNIPDKNILATKSYGQQWLVQFCYQTCQSNVHPKI